MLSSLNTDNLWKTVTKEFGINAAFSLKSAELSFMTHSKVKSIMTDAVSSHVQLTSVAKLQISLGRNSKLTLFSLFYLLVGGQRT